jgi:hypothetical protein
MSEKIKFVYLTYTVNSYGTMLTACHDSFKKVKNYFDKLPGEYHPTTTENKQTKHGFYQNGQRILQKLVASTGQIYYTEKHVLMD